MFRIGILAIVAFYLAGSFLPVDLSPAMFIASLLLLVTGFPVMSRGFRVAAIVFLTLGSALLAWSRQPLQVWMAASASMTNIIAIVAVMQTFTIPIKVGEYDAAVRSLMSGRLKSGRSLFSFMTFSTHLLACFLNLGAIPVIVSFFEETLKRRVSAYERFFASAVTRGYVLAALWSPGAVNLYLVVQATGLSWSQVFVPGFLLALAGMAISPLLEARPSGVLVQATIVADEVPASAASNGSRAIHLVLVAVAFVLLVTVLDVVGKGSSSSRIILAGAAVSLIWILILARKPGLGAAFASHWSVGLMKAADIAPFFVSMGIFSAALDKAGVVAFVAPAIQSASIELGGGAVVLIALLIVGCALVGLHPFITIVVFGKIFSHAALPIPPLTVALALSVGGSVSYMLTPFAGMTMTVSRFIGAKASDIAFRWNWRFAIVFFTTGMAFAFLWGAWFG